MTDPLTLQDGAAIGVLIGLAFGWAWLHGRVIEVTESWSCRCGSRTAVGTLASPADQALMRDILSDECSHCRFSGATRGAADHVV